MPHRLFVSILCLTLLSACASQPVFNGDLTSIPQNPYQPQIEDNTLQRGNAYLDTVEVLVMESYPVQISLAAQGSLPTPCHQLRVTISHPDDKNRILIEIYSIVDSNVICIQVLEPFQANIPLGSFSTGHYTVWVNGEEIGKFDS